MTFQVMAACCESNVIHTTSHQPSGNKSGVRDSDVIQLYWSMQWIVASPRNYDQRVPKNSYGAVTNGTTISGPGEFILGRCLFMTRRWLFYHRKCNDTGTSVASDTQIPPPVNEDLASTSALPKSSQYIVQPFPKFVGFLDTLRLHGLTRSLTYILAIPIHWARIRSTPSISTPSIPQVAMVRRCCKGFKV